MIDWPVLLIQFVLGMLSFVLGMWLFNKYFLPKMVPRMAGDIVKVLKETPEVKNLLAQMKDIVEKVMPFTEKLKSFDLEKIDAETINDLIKTVKEVAGTLKDKLEKPKNIPDPD